MFHWLLMVSHQYRAWTNSHDAANLRRDAYLQPMQLRTIQASSIACNKGNTSNNMKLISVNVARVGPLIADASNERQPILTGIHKRPTAGRVQVGALGIAGDEQADLSLHGGLDKAVYAYPIEHYKFWNGQCAANVKRVQDDLPLVPGTFGENLTIEGVLESDVWIGDRLHIGDVVLQVTEPRHPCFKLNIKLGFSHASKIMVQSGYSGFYLRVVQAGTLAAGDAVTLVPGSRDLALGWLNERRRKGRQDSLF